MLECPSTLFTPVGSLSGGSLNTSLVVDYVELFDGRRIESLADGFCALVSFTLNSHESKHDCKIF